MALEIERKFLVNREAWRPTDRFKHCKQGYLSIGPPVAVRVRIMDSVGTLNIKTSTVEIERMEFEYEIPLDDAEELLEEACLGRIVEKTRYYADYGGMRWEIDVFEGANEGLIVAEVELDDPEQAFIKPEWALAEVSHDPRYLNSNLSLYPYSVWRKR
ncbi:MAG: CYTH domain-containing protein [Candidatus Hydrogenedentes bacterium]|nr:CYTH domain-containing protein [Candidatus Hydrogenedentota bacterium]